MQTKAQGIQVLEETVHEQAPKPYKSSTADGTWYMTIKDEKPDFMLKPVVCDALITL